MYINIKHVLQFLRISQCQQRNCRYIYIFFLTIRNLTILTHPGHPVLSRYKAPCVNHLTLMVRQEGQWYRQGQIKLIIVVCCAFPECLMIDCCVNAATSVDWQQMVPRGKWPDAHSWAGPNNFSFKYVCREVREVGNRSDFFFIQKTYGIKNPLLFQ